MSQPDSAEQALEIVREMLEVPEIGLVVLDSVAGLVPEAVLQGEAGDAKIALVARLMSQQLSILKMYVRKRKHPPMYQSDEAENRGYGIRSYNNHTRRRST